MSMSDPKRTAGGALLLDGNSLRDKIIADVRAAVEALSSAPCLATVLIGDDGPSQVYVRNKHRQAQLAGMTSRNESLPRDVLQRDAEALVQGRAGLEVEPGGFDGEAQGVGGLLPGECVVEVIQRDRFTGHRPAETVELFR